MALSPVATRALEGAVADLHQRISLITLDILGLTLDGDFELAEGSAAALGALRDAASDLARALDDLARALDAQV